MKKLKYFIAFMGTILIFVAGCSNLSEKEEQNNLEAQKIKVQKSIGKEDKFEDFKEITKKEQVQKVIKILNDIDWVNASVDMVHPPDYRFVFEFKNPNIKTKALLYELWISPNKDKVELVIDTLDKYIQLDKKKSAELFEILTGGKLSNL